MVLTKAVTEAKQESTTLGSHWRKLSVGGGGARWRIYLRRHEINAGAK